MSQFKTTSSISPSISAPIAQGEVVGVGVKRRGGGVLEVTKGDAKQKNVSFWAACEVNACLGKSPWHVTDQHQQQGEAPEIARNQMPSSNSLFRVIRNSEVKLFLDQRCIAVSCFPLWDREDVAIPRLLHHRTTATLEHREGHTFKKKCIVGFFINIHTDAAYQHWHFMFKLRLQGQ